MKRFSKALLITVLALAMVLNTCGIVLADGVTAPTVTVTEEAVNDAGVKKLVFTLTTPAGSDEVTSAGIAFSFDSTIIQPVNKSGTYADVTYASSSTNADKKPLKPYTVPDDADASFTAARMKSVVAGGRVGLKYDTFNADYPVDATSGMVIAEFFFKVKEGKSPNSETFKFETEGAIFSELFGDPSTAYAVSIGAGKTTYLYGTPADDTEAIARPSMTYTGSDVLVLKSLAIARTTESVVVPKVYDVNGNATNATAVTVNLSATALSTIATEMDVPADATWKITNTDAIEGVSISGTGANAVLTVAPGASAGTATIVLASGEVSDTIDIQIVREETSAPTAMKIKADGVDIAEKITVVKPASASAPAKTVAFTSEIFDQYGKLVNGAAATFTVSAADLEDGISMTDNVLSVTNAAPECNINIDATYGTLTIGFSADIVGLLVNWNEVTVADSITYGATNASAVTLPSAGTASVDGATVNGVYSVVDADAKQNAGSATVTVKFTANADQGEYAGVEITKDYAITIAKAAYDMTTIAAAAQTSTYTGEAIDYAEANITKPADVAVTGITYSASPVNVGEYVATISFETSDANYNNPVDVTATLKVEKATAIAFVTEAVTITADAEAMYGVDFAETKATFATTATVSYGDSKTAEVEMTWADPTEEYNVKGATYTFVGTPANDNLDFGSLTLTNKLIVEAVTGELETEIPDVFIKKAFLEGEKVSHADVDLPWSIVILASNGTRLEYADVEDAVDRGYTGVLTWDKTLEELCAMNIGDKTNVTVTTAFPEWLTFDGDLTAAFEVTEKDPVNVTVTQADGVYGTALEAPVAAQVDYGFGTDTEQVFTFAYTGTTAAGTAYASAEAPTQAGSYKVTATVVSDTFAGSGEATFEIAPLAITATIADATREYSDANPTFALAATPTSVVGEDDLGITFDTTADETSNVGTYPIMGYATNKNYAVEWTNGTLTVTPKDLADTEFVPVISGTAQVGTALTATVAGLAADQYTIQWYVNASAVEGATAANYTPAIKDSGKVITVAILGVNNYTGDAAAEAVTVAKYEITGSIAIEFITDNGITGTIDESDVLGVDTTGIDNYADLVDAGLVLDYIWKINGVQVGTGATYTIPAATAGNITVEIATAAEGNFVGSIQSGAAEINKIPLAGTITLTYADTEGVKTVTADATAVVGEFDLVWSIEGTAVTATEGVYTVTPADYGKVLTVKAVAKGDIYTGEVAATYTIPAIAPEASIAVSSTATTLNVVVNAVENGATVTSYTITLKLGEEVVATYTGAENTKVFEGLTTGTQYTIVATATNAAGESAPATVTAMAAAPSRPRPSGSSSSTPSTPSTTPTTPDAGDDAGEGEDEGTTTPEADVTVKVEDTTASIDKEVIADKEAVEIATETESGVAVTTTVNVAGAAVESLEVSTKDSDKAAAGAAAEGAIGAAVEVKVEAKDAEGNKVDVAVNVTIPSEEKAYAYIIDENGVATRTESVYNEETGEVEVENVPDGAVVMISTTAPATFDDADAHWAEDTINYAVDAGIMNGVGGSTFDPDGEATRGMVNAMMVRLAKVTGAELAEAADQKVDTDAEHWAAATDLIALANGWTTGVRTLEDGTVVMDTDATVTREQLVTMLWRFVANPAAEGEIESFDDHADTSDWAKEAKAWAVGAGIINGKPGNKLDPNGTATRAEIATMFQRLMNYMTK